MAAANPIATLTKDPNESLDYTVDWADFLGADTIATVAWTVPAGINNLTSMFASKTATIWLGGGTNGTNYQITCLITTAGSRTAERTLQINVVPK